VDGSFRIIKSNGHEATSSSNHQEDQKIHSCSTHFVYDRVINVLWPRLTTLAAYSCEVCVVLTPINKTISNILLTKIPIVGLCHQELLDPKSGYLTAVAGEDRSLMMDAKIFVTKTARQK
jgi:hypothetical protein